LKKIPLTFVKNILQRKAAPTEVMGALGLAMLVLWALGFVIGICFAALGIGSSYAAMLVVIPIMTPLLFLIYTTPLWVLWNIKNAKSKTQIFLLSIGCLLWILFIAFISYILLNGITV